MGLLSFIDNALKIIDPVYAQEEQQSELNDNSKSKGGTYNKLYNTGDIINSQLDKSKITVSVEDCTIHYPGEE